MACFQFSFCIFVYIIHRFLSYIFILRDSITIFSYFLHICVHNSIIVSIFIRRSPPCNPLITIILVQSPAVCSVFRHVFIKTNTLIFYHSTVNLVKDPVSIYQADILKITDHVGYFMTAHFCYYGIVNSDDYKIVIGPTSQVPNSTPTLRDLAMQLDIPGDDIDDFIIAMQDITHIPLESLMQILCFLITY